MAWYQNYGAAKAIMKERGTRGTHHTHLDGLSSLSFSYSSRYSEYIDEAGAFHFHHRHFHGVVHEHHSHRHTPLYRKKEVLVLALTVFVLLVASALFASAENLTTIDSLYFTWSVLTTVGYGDIAPQTTEGRSILVFVGMLGLVILSLLIATIADASARRVSALVDRLVEAGTADPYVLLRNEPRACVRACPCAPGGTCCFPQLEWLLPCARPTFRTPVVRRSLNPLWNEIWIVDTDAVAPQSLPTAPDYDQHGLVLELEAYDYDALNTDDRIGVAFLPIDNASFLWQDLELPIRLDPGIEEAVLSDAPPVLHVSLRALPNSSLVEVVVIGAANLPVMDVFVGSKCVQKTVSTALEPAISAFLFILVIVIGAGIFSYIEDWRYFDGVYWAFMTVNSVGYGDFAPTQENSRLLFIPYSIVGLAVRGYAIGVLSNAFLAQTARAYLSVVSSAAASAAITRDDILAARKREHQAQSACAFCYRPTGILIRHLFYALAALAASVLVGSLIYLNEPGWSWGDGVYFCIVSLSQLGYGDFTPSNDGSKVFCIFYSVLGTLLVSVTIGIISKSKVDEAHYELKAKRESRIRELGRSLDWDDSEEEESEQQEEDEYTYEYQYDSAASPSPSPSPSSSVDEVELAALAKAARRREVLEQILRSIVLIVVFGLINLAGAYVFMELQDPAIQDSPEYGTAFYWSIVTLSTVGFGDIVPNTTESKVFLGFYIVIGLAYFAFLLGFLDKTTNQIFQFGAVDSYSSFTSASGEEAEFLVQIRQSRTKPVLPMWRGSRYGQRNDERIAAAASRTRFEFSDTLSADDDDEYTLVTATDGSSSSS